MNSNGPSQCDEEVAKIVDFSQMNANRNDNNFMKDAKERPMSWEGHLSDEPLVCDNFNQSNCKSPLNQDGQQELPVSNSQSNIKSLIRNTSSPDSAIQSVYSVFSSPSDSPVTQRHHLYNNLVNDGYFF